MYLKSKVLYLYAETPLHAGAGSGLGAVDLPIQRERITGYPIIQSGSIKGALREATPDGNEALAVFGQDADKIGEDQYAGALGIGEARVLLFPVRSLRGITAWTTSLHVLQRWWREVKDIPLPEKINPPTLPLSEPKLEGEEAGCFALEGVQADGYVVLEEFAFKVQPYDQLPGLAKWLAENTLPDSLDTYWKNLLKTNLVILRNDDFRDLVLHTTEVLTRIRLHADTKTVVSGALWTEEHLPVDTLLYVPVRASKLRTPPGIAPKEWEKASPEQQAGEALNWVAKNVPARLQLGGDETVGRGIVSLRWSPPPPDKTDKGGSQP